jgi:hypothetical protein
MDSCVCCARSSPDTFVQKSSVMLRNFVAPDDAMVLTVPCNNSAPHDNFVMYFKEN